jgi:glycosyltransferase involved in cell wall biosynthesis
MSLRVGVVCDLAEERWPSMDLVAEMLLERLPRYSRRIEAVRLQPPLRRRATALPGAARARAAFTFDRFANRLYDYPRWLRARRDGLDLFHIVDHSYSHLVHALPAARTVVTCHDLDTFRSVLDRDAEPRSAAFRAMTGRILDGFRRAARVTCDSVATRDDILRHGLLPANRLVVIPNGVHPDFTPAPDREADDAARRLLGPPPEGSSELLHVGSTIPRKGVDTLLQAFARILPRRPAAKLIQVGGPLTRAQVGLARRLGVLERVVELPFLERPVLAALYRRSQILLLPSRREGFGLPVVEAMASAAVVVASDLPVLREAAGEAALYCPPDDPAAWAAAVDGLLDERERATAAWAARRQAGVRRAARFSWDDYARRMIELYELLAQG